MKPNNEISAYNIQTLRKLSKLTQKEFAEKFGSNQKNIWAYEQGSSKPKQDFTLKLCATFGIPVEYLATVKLKISKDGKITNLPKASAEIQEIKKEIKILFTDFKNAVEAFCVGIEKINQRVDSIERKIKK